jgi:hypothetical protein
MRKIIAAAVLVLALAACDLNQPGPTTPTRVFDFCDSHTVPNFCVYEEHTP